VPAPRVLHVLSQRPSLTGSGVTLDALVRCAARGGWEQCVVVGVPADEPAPEVGGLTAERIRPLLFEDGVLDFPVPGMSDVMPYRSSRFSELSEDQLRMYRQAWRLHLAGVISEFQPDLIHVHHVWIVSSLLKDLAPTVPVVTHCHSTGFRQMALCPHLADEVKAGCRQNDRFFVLHRGHAEQLTAALKVPAVRVHVIGAGFREDLFHATDRIAAPGPDLLYVGKLSAAKGLPWLLDAAEELSRRVPGLRLHIAGSGDGAEARQLEQRIAALEPVALHHGVLTQASLAELMRQCAVCVLPSFYEGVPLVLVEALACGCRLVVTALPGIISQLVPNMRPAMELVALPRLMAVDTPDPEELPAFVTRLATGVEAALTLPPLGDPERALPGALEPFKWGSVFRRVEGIWNGLVCLL